MNSKLSLTDRKRACQTLIDSYNVLAYKDASDNLILQEARAAIAVLTSVEKTLSAHTSKRTDSVDAERAARQRMIDEVSTAYTRPLPTVVDDDAAESHADAAPITGVDAEARARQRMIDRGGR
jgi:hypothetical protein